MEQSDPATDAPEGAAAQEDKPRRTRRRPRVPTSVLVTLFVALLSVWVAPALTRQWNDREKARELKAAAAEDIATATARAAGSGGSFSRAHARALAIDEHVMITKGVPGSGHGHREECECGAGASPVNDLTGAGPAAGAPGGQLGRPAFARTRARARAHARRGPPDQSP
jgi:hypothetical protein